MPKSSKTKILIKNTGWVYIGKIGTQLLALITTILVIRKLDVDIYGTYNILLKTIVFFNIFSFSPIGTVFDRYVPELVLYSDRQKLVRLIGVGMFFVVGTSLIIAVILSIFSDAFSSFFNITSFDNYKTALFLYILVTIIRESAYSILTSALLHKQTSSLLIISSLVRSILLIILLERINVNTLLVIEAAANSVFLIPSIFVFKRFLEELQRPKVHNSLPVSRKRVIKFALFSSMNELGAGIVGKTSDHFIISAMSNLSTVGIYSFANKIYEMIFKLLPYKEFTTVIRPLFFQKFIEKYDPDEFEHMFNFMIKTLLPVFVVPVLYFIVFGKALILFVFDPKYIEAYMVCIVVLLPNIYWPFFVPVNMMMHLKERMDIALMSKIVVVFSIIAGILGMKYFGIIGVAAASLIGDLMKNLFIFFLMRREARMVYRFKEYTNYLVVLLLIHIPFALLNGFFNNSVFHLILGTILYALTTYYLIIRIHPFTPEDLALLEKVGNSNRFARTISRIIVATYQFRIGKIFKRT